MSLTSISSHSSRFDQSTRVAICRLRPASDAQQPCHIRAVVALVWPYSSSTRAISLLLAEPDIRLRKGKGQVRVTFQGPTAEAVAKAQIGIGDVVQLGLEEVEWIQSDEHVSTPGKKIGWDLVFDTKADLEVIRDLRIVATIKVDGPAQVPITIDASPTRGPESYQNGGGPHQYLHDANSWSSPIFVKEKRLSSTSFFDASLDPFTDDDGFIVGKGRKRTKFSRHSDSWRLVDRTPSPEKEVVDLLLHDVNESTETLAQRLQQGTPDQDVEAIDEPVADVSPYNSMAADTPTAAGNAQPLLYLPPPPPPHTELVMHTSDATDNRNSPVQEPGLMQPPRAPLTRALRVSEMGTDLGTLENVCAPVLSNMETPRLLPLPSPGLPLVSPLIRRPELSLGYFPDLSESRSELDASGEHQHSSPAREGGFAASNERVPSPGDEQVTLSAPSDVDKSRTPEPGVPARDAFSELGSPRPEPSLESDLHIQPVEWPSFLGGVQQTDITPHGKEQEPANAEDFNFEFFPTSPPKPNSGGQNPWQFPHMSAGIAATLDAPKDYRSLESAETSEQPADLPQLITNVVAQENAPTASVSCDLDQSDIATPQVVAVTPDEGIDATSEVTEGSSLTIPVDPILLTTREAPADVFTSTKDGIEVMVEVREQVNDSRPWSDQLDLPSIGTEGQGPYAAEPLPLQQDWHRRSGSQRSRHSSQYTSLDGVSDGVPTDEPSQADDVLEGLHRHERPDQSRPRDHSSDLYQKPDDWHLALLPALTDAPEHQSINAVGRGAQLSITEASNSSPSIVLPSSFDEESAPGVQRPSPVKEAITSSPPGPPEESVDLGASEVDNVQIRGPVSADEIRRPPKGHTEDPVLPSFPTHVEPASSDNHTTVVPETGRTGAEVSPPDRQDVSEEPAKALAEPVSSIRRPEERITEKLSNQLVTPENTQDERGDLQLEDYPAEIRRETSLPPTLQNIQEHADVPQVQVEHPIPTDSAVEVYQDLNISLPTSADEMRERRRSPRLSRKFPPSQGVTEAVSPYFAPRRTSQMRTQESSTEPSTPRVIEGSPVAANDTTEMAERENKLRDDALLRPRSRHSSPPVAPLKAGLATSLSYYPHLSLLQDHFSQLIDVLALSTKSSTEPERAESGPRDWYTTLHLTEPSLEDKQTTTAQIFRPYKTALPKVQRGNLVLLRSFKVQSQKRKFMLLSTECSAWAVFSVRRDKGGENSDIDAVVAGPPVEYGTEEKGYALELQRWWDVEGEGRHPVPKQAHRSTRSSSAKSSSVRATTNHKLRDGIVDHDRTDGAEQVGGAEPYHELRDRTLDTDDVSAKASSSGHEVANGYDRSTDSVTLHKLRDGTVYQDETPSRPPRSRQETSHAGATNTPTDDDNVKSSNESTRAEGSQYSGLELELSDANGEAEMDSGEESPTDAAVSSQIYHELRNGRRYANPPPPPQAHTKELQDEDRQDRDESVVHELRDGVTYIDE